MKRINEIDLAHLQHKILMREKLSYREKRILNLLFGQAIRGEAINREQVVNLERS